jgi:signal peptidase II
MGQGHAALFAILSVLAGAGIFYWLFIHRAAHDLRLTFLLGCIMAGVLGNLHDRLGLWTPPPGFADEIRYGVRDWILFEFQGRTWPNFNLADSFLVCGAIALVVCHLFQRDPEEEAKEAAQTPAKAA